MKKCDICGITEDIKPIRTNAKSGKNLCRKHFKQFEKYGYFKDNNPRCIFDKNEIRIKGDIAEIDTYDEYGNVVKTFILDTKNIGILDGHKWRAIEKKNAYYLGTSINQKPVYFHILALPNFPIVDHINRNTLDNRMENLRGCNNASNLKNTKIRTDNHSGVKGVCFIKKLNKWRAEIQSDEQRFTFTPTSSFNDSVIMRFFAERLLHKDYGRNNYNIIADILENTPKEKLLKLYGYIKNKISGN